MHLKKPLGAGVKESMYIYSSNFIGSENPTPGICPVFWFHD